MNRILGAMDVAHDARSPYPQYLENTVQKLQDPKTLAYIFKTKTTNHPRVPEHLVMAQELVDFVRAKRPL